MSSASQIQPNGRIIFPAPGARPGVFRPTPRPIERPSFESGRPVCPSGVQPVQSTTRVQQPDGTWITVPTGAFRCGNQQPIGGFARPM